MRSRAVSALVAVVAAALVGLGIWHGWGWNEERRTPAFPEPSDRVATAAATLGPDNPIHVAVDARRWISETDEQRLEELVAGAPVPLRVAVWYGTREAGYGNGVRGVEQLARLADEEALYALLTGPGELHYASRLDDVRIATYEFPEARGDLVRRLEEIVAALPEATSPAYESSEYAYYGGVGGAIAAGLLMGAVGIPVVLLLIGLGRKLVGRPFRMSGGWWR